MMVRLNNSSHILPFNKRYRLIRFIFSSIFMGVCGYYFIFDKSIFESCLFALLYSITMSIYFRRWHKRLVHKASNAILEMLKEDNSITKAVPMNYMYKPWLFKGGIGCIHETKFVWNPSKGTSKIIINFVDISNVSTFNCFFTSKGLLISLKDGRKEKFIVDESYLNTYIFILNECIKPNHYE